MNKSAIAIIGAVLLGAGMCVAQDQQPSLGDLAKQTKAAHKNVKTFTEADLPRSSTNNADSTPASSVAQPVNAATADAAGASTEKKDGAKAAAPTSKDSPAVAELKKQVVSYQQERDTWKKSAERYQGLLANETSDFRRKMYEDAIENDQKNVAFYQQQLDQAQTALVNTQKGSSASTNAPATASGRP